MLDASQCTRGKYVDVEGIRKTVDGGPFDAVIVMSPENIPYYSGYWNFDQRGIPERPHFVVWPRGGEPAFVVIDRRKNALQPGDTFLTDIVAYEGEELDLMRAVADVLVDRGVSRGRVGIESRFFPAGYLEELRKLLPELQFEDAFKFLESVRLIKTPAEVEVLIELASWTTEAIDTAFAAAKPGDTERSIVARMQYELLKNGADLMAFPSFGAGDRSGAFHSLATDKVVENGMIVKTDCGGFRDGYYSDVARTAVMGRATDRQRDIHARVTEIKHRIVAGIRPGMLASEAAQLGRQAYADLGLDFKWAILGHSIGLGIHESPQIYPWVHEPILPGMVMMIEVGYSDYPNDSFHVEDLIVITETGAEYRSDYSRHETLWELGV